MHGHLGPEDRNPFQTLLLGLSLFAALPLLRGDAGSATLERELSDRTVVAWGVCLLLGASFALLGSFWRGDVWNALTLERAGVFLVGGAAAVYAAVVLFSGAPIDDIRYAVSVQVAYAASCFWRTAQITVRMRWIRSIAQSVNGRG